MKNIVIFFVLCISCVLAELEFYPGFRRSNPISEWDKEQAEEFALEQLTNYLREQERLYNRPPEPEFSFRVMDDGSRRVQDVFGVAPPDPRYYEPVPDDTYQLPDYTDESPENPIASPRNEVPRNEPAYQPPQPQIPNEPVIPVPSLRDQNPGKLLNVDRPQEAVYVKPVLQDDTAGVYIIAVVAGISAAATVGLIAFGIGWYNLQKNVKSASDVEYPAYGVTGPNKDVSPTGDRRLAQSAQMYHYQHQKQQIIAMERTAATDRHGSLSEAESDEENEEGDYTVYECPGLAPTGEMEVKNPLFQDDTTPAAQSVTPKTEEGHK